MNPPWYDFLFTSAVADFEPLPLTQIALYYFVSVVHIKNVCYSYKYVLTQWGIFTDTVHFWDAKLRYISLFSVFTPEYYFAARRHNSSWIRQVKPSILHDILMLNYFYHYDYYCY